MLYRMPALKETKLKFCTCFLNDTVFQMSCGNIVCQGTLENQEPKGILVEQETRNKRAENSGKQRIGLIWVLLFNISDVFHLKGNRLLELEKIKLWSKFESVFATNSRRTKIQSIALAYFNISIMPSTVWCVMVVGI